MLENEKDNIDFAIKNAVEGGEIPAFIETAKNDFITAMEDDLNTADALAAIFTLVREINTAIAEILKQFADELEGTENFTASLNKLIKRTIKN